MCVGKGGVFPVWDGVRVERKGSVLELGLEAGGQPSHTVTVDANPKVSGSPTGEPGFPDRKVYIQVGEKNAL